MSVPVLTFFNHRGGLGQTSLLYHLAWKLSDQGLAVVAIDLDPQANLTAAFLPEEKLEALGDLPPGESAATIYHCVYPLMAVGDLKSPQTISLTPHLHLIPGALGLAEFEETLSQEWPVSLGSGSLDRPFRILSAFWQVAQLAARQHQASIVLADVGPNLGAINRSALIASDFLVIPLAADLDSLQGVGHLGPTLERWRKDWRKRLQNWEHPSFDLPQGEMKPLGYVLQQHGARQDRPVKAYAKWAQRIPHLYQEKILGDNSSPARPDPNCLASLKHYRSLVPMAQEARKPIFHLTSADGAIGGHSAAAQDAGKEFTLLANEILKRMDHS